MRAVDAAADVGDFGIEAEHLSKTYGRSGRPALQDIALKIGAGEAFGVIGPNGAGKTTLMGCLLGFLRPDCGRVTIGGRPPDDLGVRTRLGYVPERLVCDRWMTGARFLRYHHELAGKSRATSAQDVALVLQKVGLEERAASQRIKSYSKGMLQRLLFAQALLSDPRILFLDEFTSGVDPGGILSLRKQLLDLKNSGVTLVINSHRLEEIERLCDRVAFIREGKLVSVENVGRDSAAPTTFSVTWGAPPPGAQAMGDNLRDLAQSVGAKLLRAEDLSADFEITSEGDGAALLAALIRNGLEVTSAVVSERRLEELFTVENPPGAPA